MNSESVHATRFYFRFVRFAETGRRVLKSVPGAMIFCLAFLFVAEPVFSQGARRVADRDRQIVERMEFRSILAFDGDIQFSLFDPVRQMSFWIRLNETRHGVSVVNYYRENDQIEIRYGDHTRRFGLSDAEILPLVSADDTEASAMENESANSEFARLSPEERVRYITETWDAQVQQNPQLRNIDEHLNEYYQEFRVLQERMWATTDHDSVEFQRLREQRQELRDEIRILNDLTRAEIQNDPNFEGINHGSLMGTLRARHRQQVSD